MNFSLLVYIHGPYCKEVTKDAYGHTFEPEPSALSEGAETKIREFKQALKANLDDPKWLEVAASLIYLWKKNYSKRPLPEIIDNLIDDMSFGVKRFHTRLVIDVIGELQKKQFFGRGVPDDNGVETTTQ